MENEDQSINPATDAPNQADTTAQASADAPLQARTDGPSPDAMLIKALCSKWFWWCVWLLLFQPFHFTDVSLEQFRNLVLAGMPGILLLWSIVTSKKIWKGALISLLLIPAAYFGLVVLFNTFWANHQVDKESTVGRHLLRVQTQSSISSVSPRCCDRT